MPLFAMLFAVLSPRMRSAHAQARRIASPAADIKESVRFTHAEVAAAAAAMRRMQESATVAARQEDSNAIQVSDLCISTRYAHKAPANSLL